jgi:hypothetical protein
MLKDLFFHKRESDQHVMTVAQQKQALLKILYHITSIIMYFEVLDNLIVGIQSRFDQPGYQMYSQLHCLVFDIILFSRKRYLVY